VFKARASGADAILLIAAVLPNSDMNYLIKAAASVGLQCLIEVWWWWWWCGGGSALCVGGLVCGRGAWGNRTCAACIGCAPEVDSWADCSSA
jgi:hypothetical protein